MTRLQLIRETALLLLIAARCTGFVSQTFVNSPMMNECYSDGGGTVDVAPPRTSRSPLFGSRPRKEPSKLYDHQQPLMLRVFQKLRHTVVVRGPILRTILGWGRKKYLSTIMAMAIAFSCILGPMMAHPASAVDGNDAPANGVMVTKIMEPTNVDGEMQHVVVGQELCTTDSRESVAGEFVSSESNAAIQSGGAIHQSETETVEMEEIKPGSHRAVKRAAGVAAATITGGGAFAFTKRKISKGEDTLDELDTNPRIETKPIVVPVETTLSLPLCDPMHLKAREQPKSPTEEAELAAKYARIDDVGERAFQILIDLGMVEVTA